jgi:hypothetical protein
VDTFGGRVHVKGEALVVKWVGRLPDPFTAEDHAAGYNVQLSILQAECSRTQVFDRPLSGRPLFEEVIRENLDLGRPEKASLVKAQSKVRKRYPASNRSKSAAGKVSSLIAGLASAMDWSISMLQTRSCRAHHSTETLRQQTRYEREAVAIQRPSTLICNRIGYGASPSQPGNPRSPPCDRPGGDPLQIDRRRPACSNV